MLWKHKLQLILVWLLGSVAAVAMVYSLPAIYKSEAVILVESQKIPEQYVTSTVNVELQDRLATLRQTILSSNNLQTVIDSAGLYRSERKNHAPEEIIEMMRADTSITLERGWTRDRPGAFRVGYQGPDPRIVADVANWIANLFIKKNLEARESHAAGTEQFLDDQVKEAKKTLDDLEAKVSKYKLQHAGDLPEQENSLDGTLTRLQIELQGNQDAINRSQQNKLMLENALSVAESSLATLNRTAEEGAAAAAAGLASGQTAAGDTSRPAPKASEVLQSRLNALRLRYSDEHPEVKRLKQQIAQIQELEKKGLDASTAADQEAPGTPQTSLPVKSEAHAPRSFSPAMAQEIVREREKLDNLKSQITLANRELELRNAERQHILKDIATFQQKLNQLPIREQEMASLTRDYEISKSNYKSLLDKKLAAEMGAEMEHRQQSEKFTQLEIARVPEKPFKPKRILWSCFGSAVSLLLGMVIAAGRELRQGVLLGEWELPQRANILGRVPYIQIELDGTVPDGDSVSGPKQRARKWRAALVSSALVSLACIIAAAVYLAGGKF